MTLRPFHIAFPVHDLAAAQRFYREVLGCGDQIVAHLDPLMTPQPIHNAVDGHDVPVPHFGVVLTMAQWQELAERLKTAGVSFGIEPHIRFAGQVGEQATMFFTDPSGNALEFKAFADDGQLFAT
jgi:uncharacterized protein